MALTDDTEVIREQHTGHCFPSVGPMEEGAAQRICLPAEGLQCKPTAAAGLGGDRPVVGVGWTLVTNTGLQGIQFWLQHM